MAAATRRFNPMTALLKRSAVLPTASSCDSSAPCVTSIVTCVAKDRVYMTDFANKQIKIASLGQRDKALSTLSLEWIRPFKMAAVNEDVLAVSSNQGLLLLDVTRDPHVQRVIRTSRVYLGVCNGGKEQLVVGCAKDREGPASVDVISHGGQLLRTVINSERLTSLRSPSSFLGSPEAWLEQLEATFDTPKGLHWSLTSPSSLCVHEGHVMIGDFEARENGLHRVELSSGRVKDVYYPLLTAIERVQDLCMDAAGNLYLASGHFVMARSSIGQWRELLNGHDHGEGRWRGEEGGESGWLWPLAVSVTNTGLLVSWTDGHSTVVKTYDFI